MTRFLLVAILAVHAVGGECIVVDGDRIHAKDLATAVPEFAGMPAGKVIGFTPAAGVRRSFTGAELARIAAESGIQIGNRAGICVERLSQHLTEARLRAAMQPLLGAGSQLEIIDFSRYALPKGEMEFETSALPSPSAARPDTPVIWRGRLRYDETRTATIWARVRVWHEGSWVEAASPIGVKEDIRPDQLTVKTGRVFGLHTTSITDIQEVVGHRLKRSARAGDPITRDMLAERRAVEPGDMVDVSVSSGAASLRFSARAETGGRVQEKVFVEAPSGGKRLAAVVVTKGKVEIDANE